MNQDTTTARHDDPVTSHEWHQLYRTHCTKDNSCEGVTGYSLRARTPGSERYSEFVNRFPALTRPKSLEAVQDVDRLPRQLAYVQLEGTSGQCALVHSNFLERDTLDRPNNYFRHVLIGEAISIRDAIRCWDSPDWTCRYAEDAPKDLSLFSRMPQFGTLSDQTLREFLSAQSTPDDNYHLNEVTIPPRLGNAEDRHRVVRQAIQGALAVLARDSGGPRQMYLHCEPGLATMLLWAIARLVPESLLATMTFSNYFAAGSRLREFDQARIIGVLADSMGGKIDRNDAEVIVVDTFTAAATSPQLQSGGDWVDVLLNSFLTAPDDLDAIHRIIDSLPNAKPDDLRETCQVWDEYQLVAGSQAESVTSRKAQLAAFQKLIGTRVGKAAISNGSSAGNGCWSRLRGLCLNLQQADVHDRVVSEFRSILELPQQIEELREDVVARMQQGSYAEWHASWKLLLSLLSDTKEQLAELQRQLDGLGAKGLLNLHIEIRLTLLSELQRLGGNKFSIGQYPLLLVVQQAAHLKKLIEKCPAGWAVLVLGTNVEAQRDDMEKIQDLSAAAARHLCEGGQKKLAAQFCKWLNQLEDTKRIRMIVQRLIGADLESSQDVLIMLIEHGFDVELLPDGNLDELIEYHFDFSKVETTRYTEKLVTTLLNGVTNGQSRSRIMKDLLGRLTYKLLLDDAEQARLFALLTTSARKCAELDVSDEIENELDQWLLLRQRVDSPMRYYLRQSSVVAAGLAFVLLFIVVGWFGRAMMFPGV